MREGWTYKKLGEVCTSITDGSHNPPKGIEHSEYRMISSQNIFDDDLRINDETVRFLTEEDHYKEDKRTKLSKDVVLLTIVGTIGRACVLAGTEGFLTLQRSVAALKPSEKVDSRFLMHCLIGNRGRLNQEAHGIAQRGIYLRQLSELDIPIPPLSEQQSIVAELDKINELISLKKAQLSDLDSLAQSIFYDMFGDPIENEKGWEVKELEEMCSCITKGTTPTTLGFSFTEKGINFVKVESFIDGHIDHSKLAHITYECNMALLRSQLRDEDLLICIAGATIGKMAVVDTSILPANTNQACAIVRLKDKNNLRFLHAFIALKLKEYVIQMGKGVAQPNLSLGQLRKLIIFCPPLSLQQDFAKRIELIEQQKAQISSTIKDLETLLASRMQYWFD